jgi:MbtH protein
MNPFENPEGTYHVLINEEGQHSLWPTFAEIPKGWSVALPATDRQTAIDYVNEHWTDMRPLSLVKATEKGENDGRGAGSRANVQRANDPAVGRDPAA